MWRLSPLHHAALSGNKELISLLLEAQAAVDIKDHKGKNTHRCWQSTTHYVTTKQARNRQGWAENKTATKRQGNKYAFPCVTIRKSYVIKREIVGNAIKVACSVYEKWQICVHGKQETIEEECFRLQDWEPSGSRAANISISHWRIPEGRRRNLRADGRYNPSRMSAYYLHTPSQSCPVCPEIELCNRQVTRWPHLLSWVPSTEVAGNLKSSPRCLPSNHLINPTAHDPPTTKWQTDKASDLLVNMLAGGAFSSWRCRYFPQDLVQS